MAAKEWSIRCVYETFENKDNICVTLTYKPEYQTKYLQKTHYREFIDNIYYDLGVDIKKKIPPEKKIKYFGCGEYGSFPNYLPHWHIILFNYTPGDLFPAGNSKQGTPLYNSKKLEKIWNKGLIKVGLVDAQTAAYCALYTIPYIDESYSEKDKRPFKIYSPGIGRTQMLTNLSKTHDINSVVNYSNGKAYDAFQYQRNAYKANNPKAWDYAQAERQELQQELQFLQYRISTIDGLSTKTDLDLIRKRRLEKKVSKILRSL